MMKLYTEPTIRVILCSAEDVIATSTQQDAERINYFQNGGGTSYSFGTVMGE